MLSFLVVEDEPAIANMLSDLINDNYPNSIVKMTRDGEEAFKACHQIVFDVIITDIKMPNMSGDELIIEIRDKLSVYDDTPIIVVSAFVSEQVSKLASFTHSYCLTKPLLPNELLKMTNLSRSKSR